MARIPPEIIQRVREIQVRTGRQVADVLAGEYVPVFKGHGVEFDEVRPYVPGDDVRSIDWNVSARMGHPYVKKFTEERELTVVLVVDASGSERFRATSPRSRSWEADAASRPAAAMPSPRARPAHRLWSA